MIDTLIKQVREGNDATAVLEDSLQEAVAYVLLDADSASDREKIEKILKQKKIKYSKKGSEINVDLKRDSVAGAALIAMLRREKIKFDDIR